MMMNRNQMTIRKPGNLRPCDDMLHLAHPSLRLAFGWPTDGKVSLLPRFSIVHSAKGIVTRDGFYFLIVASLVSNQDLPPASCPESAPSVSTFRLGASEGRWPIVELSFSHVVV